MSFKMKGEPMKRNFGVGGPAKLKKEKEASPVKAMGNFEINPRTGEYVRVSTDFANRPNEEIAPGTTGVRTGEDAVKARIKDREDQGKPMTRKEIADYRRIANKGIAEDMGIKAPKGSMIASEIDQRIQAKIDAGRRRDLTKEEQEYERRQLAALNKDR